jgi:hypothetical protein
MAAPEDHLLVPLEEVVVRLGMVDGHHFNADCLPGDVQNWAISFGDDTPFTSETPVHVIVTGNDRPAPFSVREITEKASVVGVAQNIDQHGFQLRARNSGCVPGTAGFNWLAVQPTPGVRQKANRLHRMGVVPPRRFQPDCSHGDRDSWHVRFSPKLNIEDDKSIVPLVTPTNMNVMGTCPAVVGCVEDVSRQGFVISARNSDSGPSGDCSFYYAIFTSSQRTTDDYWMACGNVDPQLFQPDDRPGDWRMWHIYFSRPFVTPPIVLMTANNSEVPQIDTEFGLIAHAVGVAQNVTPFGFTIAARNSSCIQGWASFDWLAFGSISPS